MQFRNLNLEGTHIGPTIRLPSRSTNRVPWIWGCNLVWPASGGTYLRPSARKMIFLSSTAEAKIWIICSKWRQCNRALKSTCSRWESRGLVSEMNCGKIREKGFSNTKSQTRSRLTPLCLQDSSHPGPPARGSLLFWRQLGGIFSLA